MSDARPAVARGVPVLPDISVPRPRICQRETVHRNPFHTVEAVLAESQGFAKDYAAPPRTQQRQRGRIKQSSAVNLRLRLRRYADAVLRFLAAESFCTIRSYLTTLHT